MVYRTYDKETKITTFHHYTKASKKPTTLPRVHSKLSRPERRAKLRLERAINGWTAHENAPAVKHQGLKPGAINHH